MSTFTRDPRLTQDNGFSGVLKGFGRRIKGGDLGALPVVIGIVVIWTIFQTQNENFLTPNNLTNVLLQVASMGLISVGVFFVLLLGDVDLFSRFRQWRDVGNSRRTFCQSGLQP